MNFRKFDVNEQNDQAVGFYKKCGFETTSRSELDFSGKPYQTLHVELRN
jgi:putative acetyltransferase